MSVEKAKEKVWKIMSGGAVDTEEIFKEIVPINYLDVWKAMVELNLEGKTYFKDNMLVDSSVSEEELE